MAQELKGIRYQSETYPKLTTLINRINEESLKEAHRRQKTGKAAGVDGVTKEMYEENLDEDMLTKAVIEIENADMLIIGGTSLVVYPAAGLIRYYRGDRLVLINRDATPADSYADLVIHDSIGKVLGSLKI